MVTWPHLYIQNETTQTEAIVSFSKRDNMAWSRSPLVLREVTKFSSRPIFVCIANTNSNKLFTFFSKSERPLLYKILSNSYPTSTSSNTSSLKISHIITKDRIILMGLGGRYIPFLRITTFIFLSRILELKLVFYSAFSVWKLSSC